MKPTGLMVEGWDGKLNGVYQPQGVYIYFIDVVLDDREEERYNGMYLAKVAKINTLFQQLKFVILCGWLECRKSNEQRQVISVRDIDKVRKAIVYCNQPDMI